MYMCPDVGSKPPGGQPRARAAPQRPPAPSIALRREQLRQKQLAPHRWPAPPRRRAWRPSSRGCPRRQRTAAPVGGSRGGSGGSGSRSDSGSTEVTRETLTLWGRKALVRPWRCGKGRRWRDPGAAWAMSQARMASITVSSRATMRSKRGSMAMAPGRSSAGSARSPDDGPWQPRRERERVRRGSIRGLHWRQPTCQWRYMYSANSGLEGIVSGNRLRTYPSTIKP